MPEPEAGVGWCGGNCVLAVAQSGSLRAALVLACLPHHPSPIQEAPGAVLGAGDARVGSLVLSGLTTHLGKS